MTIFYNNIQTLSGSNTKNNENINPLVNKTDQMKQTIPINSFMNPPFNNMVSSSSSSSTTSSSRPIPDSLKCICCHDPISDQYYYVVDGWPWHSSCLRCDACKMTLTNMSSCFCKNNKIWCRRDYDRQFRCQKCHLLLKPSDLIMRTSGGNSPYSKPYHVGCFRCDSCNVLLLAGDSYGCLEDQLFCKTDFIKQTNKKTEWIINTDPDKTAEIITDVSKNSNDKDNPNYTDNPLSALCQLSMNEYIRSKLGATVNKYEELIDREQHLGMTNNENSDCQLPIDSTESCESNNDETGKSILKLEKSCKDSPLSQYDQDDKLIDDAREDCISEMDCMGTGKELVDQSSLNDVSTINTEDEGSHRSGSEDMDDSKLQINSNDTLNTNKSNINSKKSSSSSRQKRVRTSFKHQQLRTMKAYFAMNHNPDSKDLRQLSQKTGLSKRVLQVWFQNARAKFRRSLCRQSGVICHPNGNQLISGVFDESLLSMDKNGNYPPKSKVNNFNDLPTSMMNHNIPRICTMADLNYSSSNMLPSLANLRENSYIPPNNKPFISTSNNFYNSPTMLNIPPPPNPNSPSLFSIDLNNLSAISDFARDNNNNNNIQNETIHNFQLTELGLNHNSKLANT